ncbi:MAG: HEPN domain-containing protein [Ignavibacteriales bacterium]|nr:HEPN domain-containing protein [Ignavibacteriales bacterium]
MNRSSFKRISKIRVGEAKKLLEENHFCGAYYLIGYSIECALKACISKQIKKYDFPDKKLVSESHTHDLEKLIKISGLITDFDKDRKNNSNLELNWTIVKDWSEASRYSDGFTENQALDLYNACTNRQNGILTWIKRRW